MSVCCGGGLARVEQYKSKHNFCRAKARERKGMICACCSTVLLLVQMTGYSYVQLTAGCSNRVEDRETNKLVHDPIGRSLQ
jgi:hypothetical protein